MTKVSPSWPAVLPVTRSSYSTIQCTMGPEGGSGRHWIFRGSALLVINVWQVRVRLLTIVSNMKQSVLNQPDCAHYYKYKIRQMIVLILQPSGHVRRLTSKRYFSRFTCLKCNRKTVLNSGNSAGTNSRRPALISKLTQKSWMYACDPTVHCTEI